MTDVATWRASTVMMAMRSGWRRIAESKQCDFAGVDNGEETEKAFGIS